MTPWRSLVIDENEATLKCDSMGCQGFFQCWRIAIWRAGSGDGLGFPASVACDVLGKLQHHARRVLTKLGGVRRKPAVNGAIHQLKAEQEHEDRRCKSDKCGTEDHPRPETRAESTAALIRVELQNVAEQ